MYSERVTVEMTPKQKEFLTKVSKLRGQSRADFIREAVQAYLVEFSELSSENILELSSENLDDKPKHTVDS